MPADMIALFDGVWSILSHKYNIMGHMISIADVGLFIAIGNLLVWFISEAIWGGHQ